MQTAGVSREAILADIALVNSLPGLSNSVRKKLYDFVILETSSTTLNNDPRRSCNPQPDLSDHPASDVDVQRDLFNPSAFGLWIERACGFGAEVTNSNKYGGLSTRGIYEYSQSAMNMYYSHNVWSTSCSADLSVRNSSANAYFDDVAPKNGNRANAQFGVTNNEQWADSVLGNSASSDYVSEAKIRNVTDYSCRQWMDDGPITHADGSKSYMSEPGGDGHSLLKDRVGFKYCLDESTGVKEFAFGLENFPHWDGTPRAEEGACELWGAEDLGLDIEYFTALHTDATIVDMKSMYSCTGMSRSNCQGSARMSRNSILLKELIKMISNARVCLPKKDVCKGVNGAPLVAEVGVDKYDEFGNQKFEPSEANEYICDAHTTYRAMEGDRVNENGDVQVSMAMNRHIGTIGQINDGSHPRLTSKIPFNTEFKTKTLIGCNYKDDGTGTGNRLVWGQFSGDLETHSGDFLDSEMGIDPNFKCTVDKATGKISEYCRLKIGTSCGAYANDNPPGKTAGNDCMYVRDYYKAACKAAADGGAPCKWEDRMGCASTSSIEDLKELMCTLGEDLAYWKYMKGIHLAFLEFGKQLGVTDTGRGYLFGDCETTKNMLKSWTDALFDVTGIRESDLAKIPLVGPALVVLGRLITYSTFTLQSKETQPLSKLFSDLPNFAFRQTLSEQAQTASIQKNKKEKSTIMEVDSFIRSIF